MSKGLVASASAEIDAAPERVWKTLTDPALVKQWMFGTTIASSWKVGSPVTFKGEWQGRAYEDKGTIVTFDAPKTLAYTHFSPLMGKPDVPENYHTVTIRLTSSRSGTRVTLDQDNNATVEAQEHSRKNWEMALASLKKVAETSG